MNEKEMHELEKKVKIVGLSWGEVKIHNTPKEDFEIIKKLGVHWKCGKNKETHVACYGGVTFFASKEEAGE